MGRGLVQAEPAHNALTHAREWAYFTDKPVGRCGGVGEVAVAAGYPRPGMENPTRVCGAISRKEASVPAACCRA
ncbi:MAG: hypothetical protein RRA35_07710 [Desulfomonilia bacterium]|nr:hypothetical protein [Desulfomonilia bacterium]